MNNEISFPVGYHPFHKTQFFNFQLNRWHSIGLARYEDMLESGKNIKKYEDWKPEMIRISQQAEKENRLMNAAIYYRSAEFYTLYQDPDKVWLYDKFSWIFEFFLKYENFFNKSAFMKMERNPRMKWEIGNTMRITKSETPFEGAQLNLSLSRENMHADQITQDVLFISGKEDHFIPIRLHNQQVKALTNARSVTDRVFTKAEHAQNHCQVGNIGLLLDTVIRWIEEE